MCISHAIAGLLKFGFNIHRSHLEHEMSFIKRFFASQVVKSYIQGLEPSRVLLSRELLVIIH